MKVEDAIRELRVHFRRKAQHPHDCVCACCEAIEVLEMAVRPKEPEKAALPRNLMPTEWL